MTGIPEWLMIAILTAIGFMAKWGINRFVKSQDELNETLKEMNERLGKINGRVGKMETWQSMHENSDNERHEHVDKLIEALWNRINHGRGNNR